MSRKKYLILTACALLLFFALGRIGFIMNNSFISPCSTIDCIISLFCGIPQDVTVISFLLFYPLCIAICTIDYPNMNVRRWLIPYYIVACLVLTLIVVVDGMMYEHWEFKLDNCIFSYASSPEGATSSVSVGYIIGVVSVFVAAFAVCLGSCLMLIPKHFTALSLPQGSPQRTRFMARVYPLIFLPWLLLMAVSVGTSYWSKNLFLNHVSTNSVFNLAASVRHDMRSYDKQFVYTTDQEATEIVNQLFPKTNIENTVIEDTLLNTRTPNILFIQLESCGSVFVEALGGAKESSPNLTKYAKEGILFDNVYANSFRTDRGTVSALSSYVSYPTASLMLMPNTLDKIPSLAHSLAEKGYTTDYQYGGVIANMGKENYLRHAGFQNLTSVADYDLPAEVASSWGANDSITFHHAFDLMMEREKSGKPWLFGQQALSSHEPWEVDYHVCDNPILNAFAYTDHHMGLLIERLKKSELWDNLLVIIYSDHGFLYNQTFQDPEYFHIPVVWTGGAVKQPRVIHTLMSQSDLMTTVLGQMGISHKQFPWGHDVMTKEYQDNAFAYCNFPAGLMYMDKTGTTIVDIHADKPVYESETKGSALREKKAKAILQKSYDELNELAK